MTLDHLRAAVCDAPSTDSAIVPLSSAQRSIWFAQQLAPETPISIAQYVDLDGDLDTDLLTRVGRQVVREFGVTMIRLIPSDDPTAAPLQSADADAHDEMSHVDLRDRPDPEAAARAWMDAEFRAPLDLFDDRLIESATLRIGDRRYFWYTRVHHLLLDGYGAAALTQRIAELYTALAAGEQASATTAGTLAELVADDEKYRSSTRFDRDRAHWAERIADLPEPIRLAEPAGRSRPGSHSVGGVLDADLHAAMERFASAHGSTVAAVVAAASAAYLAQMGSVDDVVLSLPVSARTNALLRRSGGMVSNVVPIRLSITGATTVADLLRQVTAELSGALRHQRYRYEDMMRDRSGGEQGATRSFFGPAINIMMFRDEVRLGGLVGRSRILSTGPTDDLAFTAYSGDELRIDLEGNAASYRLDELQAHHRRFLGLVADLVAAAPDTSVAAIGALSDAERAALVPARGPAAPAAQTLPDLLADVARRHADLPALRADGAAWTYRELWQQINRLARTLIEEGVAPGDVVAVLAHRGPEAIIAELAVVVAGAAFVPIDAALPDERIAYLLADSRACLGLVGPGADTPNDAAPGDAGLRWLQITADLAARSGAPVVDSERRRPLRVDDAAYLIYTSGSTGLPKGVVVTHRGAASFVAEQRRRYDVAPGERTLAFASLSFDASILELLLALASGATLVMAPRTLYGGRELAELLGREEINHAFITPAALGSVPATELPALRTVIVGGEACSADLVARWAPGRAMFNAYGPTEATIMATLAGPLPAAGESISIGAPIVGMHAVLLDRRLRPVPVGATGELYLGGSGVARGYQNAPARTAHRFIADPYGAPGARLYRTGDLARWRADGRLDYRGRADQQVKIRGFRIELGEIESAIAAVPGVTGAVAALATTSSGRRVLAGYYVGAAEVDVVTAHLRTVLPAHAIPAAIAGLDALPLTSSGKLDRAALPAPEITRAEFDPPRTRDEELVATAFADCLGTVRVGRADDFFALGGDSLSATRLAADLGARLDTQIPVRAIFEAPTVASLAARFGDHAGRSGPELCRPELCRPALCRTDSTDAIPLSAQQQRMWIVNRLDTASPVFNIPLVLRLSGPLEPAALAAAFADLVDRHEPLRTVYPDTPNGPVQRIVDRPDVHSLEPEDVAAEEVEARIVALGATGFDVAAQIPVRPALLRVSDSEHVLVCVVHHIVLDGSSTAPLAADLAVAYRARRAGTAPAWTPLSVRYRDYARWHRDLMGDAAAASSLGAQQLDYWRTNLAGAPEVLELPTDRPRGPVPGTRGGLVRGLLDAPLVRRIRAHAAATGTTAFMVNHAALAISLARLTGTDDVSVGTPVAGRSHRDLVGLVGMFAGTVVLRTPVDAAGTFADLLHTVRETDLAAFENADVPFDRVVDAVAPRRSAAVAPLFQVGFSYQNMGATRVRLDGLEVTIAEPDVAVSKSDLHLTLVDDGAASGGIRVQWDYDAELFDEATIMRWHRQWLDLLDAALTDPDRPVGDLAVDASTALTGPVTGRPDATLTYLLDLACRRHPDAVALWTDSDADSDADEAVDYAALDRRANGLARRLIARGVGPGDRVAVAMVRSAEFVEAVFAVLRAGGAYVPIDPAAPAERTAAILSSAAPALVLVAGPTDAVAAVPGVVDIRDLDVDAGARTAPVTDADRHRPLMPQHPAYVIYTSGSTGAPKGVEVSHRAIAAQLRWKSEAFPVGPGDNLVFKTPATFDLSVWELFWPLMNGARLVVARPDGHTDPRYIADLLRRVRPVAVHFVPSLLEAHLDAIGDSSESAHRPATVLCIGEALRPATARRAAHALGAVVENLYGPTEAAVGITRHTWRPAAPDVTAGSADHAVSVPIGRPVDDSGVLVLDTRLHPVPVGVVGELYLRGVQLATAYEGRADLTAARFVADPAGPRGSRLYRTGDLARVRADGAIDYVGRNDFQVKIRGQRIELGEIEHALTRHRLVSAAAVAVHQQRLIAYLVPSGPDLDTDLDTDAVLRDLATRVPRYLVPDAATVLTELPRNRNGKLDRDALPEPPRTERVHRDPETPAEHAVLALLGELLGEHTAAPIGLADDFFELGGNSLSAARLSARIADDFGVVLPVRTVFDSPVIGDLARAVETAARADRPAPVRRDQSGRVPLSRPQRRMWLLDQLDPGSALYNLPFVLTLDGPLDLVALRAAVAAVLDRQHALRSVFGDHRGVGFQEVLPTEAALASAGLADLAPAPLRTEDIADQIAQIASTGFALADEIAFRLRVFTLNTSDADNDERHLVVGVVHHIAADGWSLRVLAADLLAAYSGQTLAELPVQYTDFAPWQAGLLGDPTELDGAATERHPSMRAQFDYWDGVLTDLPEPLSLPVDRTRPAVSTRAGGTVHASLDADLVSAAHAFAVERRASLFHVVHAAFALVLARITGAADIVVGTPVAGRTAGAVDEVIGMFVETVVLRTRIDENDDAARLVDRVRHADLSAMANAEIPFDELADAFEPDRGGAHHPLFQVMLAFGDPTPEPIQIGELLVTPTDVEIPLARFDLHLTVETPRAGTMAGPLGLRWTYATELFDEATVTSIADRFTRVLGALVAAPAEPLHRIDVLDTEERALLAVPATAHDSATLVDRLAAGGADVTGPLLVGGADTVSAGDFRRRVNRTARALIAAGVGPESTVAIAVRRSVDLLVALHATVVAGGAYVPIDPTQPAVRIAGMLEITAPTVIIADPDSADRVPAGSRARIVDPRRLHLDLSDSAITDRDRRGPLRPEHPAYILFTSGSTGEPKAVAISHRAIVNRLDWMQASYPIDHHDTVLQKTPITFDVSVWELFWPYSSGARTVLAEPEAHRDPVAMAELIDTEQITVIHFVPAMLDAFLAARTDARLASLRFVFTSGEALSATSAAALLARVPATQLHNLYGPTEAAVDVTAAAITDRDLDGRPVAIGRPTPGTAVFVLDRLLRPVPVGTVGELYLGGVQVARGYHGRSALSAARFVASPVGDGERLYRTGDLVRWRHTDSEFGPELEFAGRSDFQIKVRGQRVESGEIESVLTAHPAVASAVVVLHDDPRSGAQLVAHVVSVPATAPTLAQLRDHLAAHVPDHMVPAHLLITDALPLTSSGKVDRTALALPPTPLRNDRGGLGRTPSTAAEVAVLAIIRDLLGDAVGVEDDFFHSGGNSLTATRVVAGIAEEFDVRVPVRAIFEERTAAAIAAAVDRAAADRVLVDQAAVPAASSEFRLTAAQRQMWLHNRIDPASTAYLILAPLRLPAGIDPALLAAAAADVVARHDALRTVYPETADGPRPRVLDADEYSVDGLVTCLDAVTDPVVTDPAAVDPAVTAALATQLDLRTDLPLRIFMRRGTGHTVVVLAVHHIAADGWSIRLLAEHLSAAYLARCAGTTPEPAGASTSHATSYADYARARGARIGDVADPTSIAARDLNYWRGRLAELPAQIAPARDGVSTDTDTAEVHRTTLPAAAATDLTDLAARAGATVFAVLHAGLAVALARSAGTPSVVIGTPLSGREEPGVADTVGMMVTTVPLRSDIAPAAALTEVLAHSQRTVIDALDHGGLDVEEIVDGLALPRAGRSHPLIHATLTVEDRDRADVAGLAAETLRVDLPAARFDLEFSAVPDASGALELSVVHRSAAYLPRTAALLLERWAAVVRAMIADPAARVADVELTAPADRAVLAAITTGPPPPRDRFLTDVLATAGQALVAFDADSARREYSDAEISGHAHRLARLLIERGAGPETVVALCLSRSYESVIAVRAVAATGAAFVPVDPRYPADRIAFMLADSGATLVLTCLADRDRLATDTEVIVVDAPVTLAEIAARDDRAVVDRDRRAALHPDQTAYLIYTSGSSGQPKAVDVTHRGIASFVAEQARYGVTACSRVMAFASPSFDASLLELLMAADAGATTVVVPTSVYGADALAQLLRDEAVTHAFLTPAVLDTLDHRLPDLTTIIVGGDACAPATAARWIDRGVDFFNAYGPTETTVMATLAGPIGAGERTALPLGSAVTGSSLRVLDEHLRPALPGAVGEAYVSGPGLARGYRGRAGLTAATFVTDPDGPPGARRYRTGDLVAAVPTGAADWALTHRGRADSQLKIRGHRIELGEVENAVRACPGIRAAVVVGRPGPDGTTALIAYVVGDDVPATEALRERLRSVLPAPAIPAAFVPLGEIPTTTSGKVDQRALPAPDFSAGAAAAAVTTSAVLVGEVFADLFGTTELGAGHFFDLGGNSLMAAQAAAQIRERSGRELSVGDLFDAPTVADLAALLEQRPATSGHGIGDLPRPDRVPLAPAQQGMWFLNRFDPDARTENIPLVIRMAGDLDRGAFLAAADRLIRRHEVLRTAYPDSSDGPWQHILPADDHGVRIEVREVAEDESADAVASYVERGFDVTAAPPVRAALLHTGDGAQHVFVLVLHHIAADGLSVVTLADELAADYRRQLAGEPEPLVPEPVQFADYAVWQRDRLEQPDGPMAAHLASWQQWLAGAPVVIELPRDRPRPAVPTGAGARIDFEVAEDLHVALIECARDHGATPFMVAHTALAILLGRLGAGRDVVVGTPTAGREDARLAAGVGMFVTMAALRTEIGPEVSGRDALAVGRAAALHAFAHGSVPFDAIVAGLDLPRSTAHHPVFQVAFSFQNIGPLALDLPGLDVTVVDDPPTVAEFDLHLTLAERGTGLTGQLVYATDLFDEPTAVAVTEQYVRILRGLIADPDRPVGDLAIMDDAEPQVDAVFAASAESAAAGLADGFLAQAARTPTAAALVVDGAVLTYADFACRAQEVAAVLRRRGVGAEDRVGVVAPRGLHQILALYATALCGAAYVPIDPSAPQRAALILAAADPALVLGVGPEPAIGVDDRCYLDLADLPAVVDSGSAPPVHPAAAAYVLFTSGSSGVPKGVSVAHASVARQLAWMQRRYPIGPDDTVLLRTPAGFDLSVWEYWWALQTGARIVIAEDGTERDGIALRRQLTEHRVTALPTVPSGLAMILDAGPLPSSITDIWCIGAELPPELVARLRNTGSNARVHNLYGPTECTVSATGFEVPPGFENEAARIPIGTPQPAVVARVLDARLHPVPTGVVGELYLGGIQVARGYHGDPARTAAAFVADPQGSGRIYRTGDLVRRTRDGLLEYVGRTDFQLQLRGFRIEPGEIESVLRRCRGVTEAVVTVLDDSAIDDAALDEASGGRLVAFVTGAVDLDDLAHEVADRLPGYLRPELHHCPELPVNANGKIDRAQLPTPQRPRRAFRLAVTETERAVAEVVAEVTGADRPGMADDFFALGGNSLSATRIGALLEQRLGRSIPVRLVFDAADLGDLAARIDGIEAGAVLAPLLRINDDAPMMLAPAQRRIWEAVVAGQGADWNVPIALRFTGSLDLGALRRALIAVLGTHEALRTRYRGDADGTVVDGAVVDVLPMVDVEPLVTAGLTPMEVTADDLPRTVSDLAWAPLDLATAPMRIRLLRPAPDTVVLVLVVHHLNVDGRSLPILARDVLTAFTAESAGMTTATAAPPIRFRDYARWRWDALLSGGEPTAEYARQLAYWTDQFGPHTVTGPGLVTDRPRPQTWDSTGASVEIEFGVDLHRDLDALARRHGTGLFPIVQAAFAVVLSARTGRDTVHVATANANRNHAAVAEVIGNFAEDIPMRIDVGDQRLVAEMIDDVHRQLVGGLEHPDISVPSLLDCLGVARTPGGATGHPVFPATLILQQADLAETALADLDLGAVRIAPEPIAATVAKHELEVTLLELRDGERPAGVRGTLLYPTALFTDETADEIAADLLAVIETIAAAGGVDVTAAQLRKELS